MLCYHCAPFIAVFYLWPENPFTERFFNQGQVYEIYARYASERVVGFLKSEAYFCDTKMIVDPAEEN